MKKTIKLSKKIYEVENAVSALNVQMGRGTDNKDRDFKEFTVKKYTVKDFFKMYNTAFISN